MLLVWIPPAQPLVGVKHAPPSSGPMATTPSIGAQHGSCVGHGQPLQGTCACKLCTSNGSTFGTQLTLMQRWDTCIGP